MISQYLHGQYLVELGVLRITTGKSVVDVQSQMKEQILLNNLTYKALT